LTGSKFCPVTDVVIYSMQPSISAARILDVNSGRHCAGIGKERKLTAERHHQKH
jgi:hypothetical protein